MNKLARIAAIVAVVPTVAACDIIQSIVVTPDGRVEVVYDIALEPSMLMMAELTPDEFCPVDASPEGLPEGVTATAELIRTTSQLTCRVTARGDISQLPALFDEEVGLAGAETGSSITLVDEGGGIYTYTILIGSPEEAAELGLGATAGLTPEEQAMQAQMQMMMAQFFMGRTFEIHLSAPAILETNGELSIVNGLPTASFVLPTYEFAFPPANLEPVFGPDGTRYNYRFFVRFDVTP